MLYPDDAARLRSSSRQVGTDGRWVAHSHRWFSALPVNRRVIAPGSLAVSVRRGLGPTMRCRRGGPSDQMLLPTLLPKGTGRGSTGPFL
jgi:hypothetical protein